MKNTVTKLLLLAAVCAALASGNAFAAPISTTTLDNGLKVIVNEDHSASLVAIDVWVGAGTVHETPATSGVSHFIEHLLFRATDNRGPGQVDMEIESLGATLEARTSRDWAHFYTVVDKKYLDKALDVISDVVTHPLFRQVDLEHERDIILDEIARKESDPFLVLEDKLYSTAFTTHPYRLPVEGTRESVTAMKRDTVVDYYRKLYVPENMSVVVVGDIAADAATAAVKKTFADMKKAPFAAPEAAQEPARTQKTRTALRSDTKLTYVGIAFIGPSIKDRKDVLAMDVLLAHLGIGYQSWMTMELRDAKHLAVQVSSDYLTQKDPALVILSAACEPAKASAVEAAVIAKITDLRTAALKEDEVNRAKRWLQGTNAFDVETFSGRATNYGFYNTIGALDIAENYQKSIDAVKAQDVLDCAKKYLDPDKAAIVVLGP